MSNESNASEEAAPNRKGKRKSGATSTKPPKTGPARKDERKSGATSATSATETPLPEAEFLKIDEVAVILNVARRTVDNMIRSGELESYRFRANRRVARKDLDAYMERARLDDRPTRGERHREAVSRPRRRRTASNA